MSNFKKDEYLTKNVLPGVLAAALVLCAILGFSIHMKNISAQKTTEYLKKMEQRVQNDFVTENALILQTPNGRKIILHVPAFDPEVSIKRDELPEIDFVFYGPKGTHQRVKPTLKTEKFYLYDLPSDVEDCARYSIQLIRKGIVDELFADNQFRVNTVGQPQDTSKSTEEIVREKNCLTVLDLSDKL